MTLTVGDLFSGIGGFALGLTRAGMQIKWACEIEPYCRAVYNKHWPGVPIYDDITKLTNPPYVDVLCGGFPCQPVSVAGRRKGQADHRWLWPEFARLVAEIRPRYVIAENVPGLLGQGMADVMRDLSASGYDAEWDTIPASAFGAPHRRDRIWIVAHPNGPLERRAERQEEVESDAVRDTILGGCSGEHGRGAGAIIADGYGVALPNTASGVLGWWEQQSQGGEGTGLLAHAEGERLQRGDESGQCPCELLPWACCRTHEDERLTRSGIRRVSHGVPHRTHRLRALGNAVVPQIVEWIGRRIIEADGQVRSEVLL